MAGIGVGLAASGVSGLSLGASVVGFGVGLLSMLPGHALGATGAGDVKLMAAIGALVGPGMVVNAFLFTAVAGGVLAVAVALRQPPGSAPPSRGRPSDRGPDRSQAADRIGDAIEPVRVRSSDRRGQRARGADGVDSIADWRLQSVDLASRVVRHTHMRNRIFAVLAIAVLAGGGIGVRHIQRHQQPAGRDGPDADEARRRRLLRPPDRLRPG